MFYGIIVMEYLTLFLYLSAIFSIVRVRKHLRMFQVALFSIPIVLTTVIVINALTSEDHLQLGTLSVLMFLSYIYYYLAYNLKSKFYNPVESYATTIKSKMERLVSGKTENIGDLFSSLKSLMALPIGQKNHIDKSLLFERKHTITDEYAMFSLLMIKGSRSGFFYHDQDELFIVDNGKVKVHTKDSDNTVTTTIINENDKLLIKAGVPHDMEALEFSALRCYFNIEPKTIT